MSEQTKTAQEELVKASETLYEKVYVPAFLKEAARQGLALRTEKDVEDALKVAALVRCHEIAAAEKQAQDTSTLLSKAASLLEQNTLGVAEQTDASDIEIDDEIKSAALKLLS